MLRFLNSKNPLIKLLIPIFAILFVFNWPEEFIRNLISEDNAFLYKNLLLLIKGNYFVLFYKILLVLFLIGNSIYFSQILLFFKLYKKRNFLHAFILLFLLSVTIKLTDVLPILIAMFLFLVAMKTIMNTLRKKSALFDCFNVGILMSAASFFWFNAVYFSLIIFLCLLLLRTLNWREWLVPVIGIFVPYFIIISFYFIIFSNFDIIFDIHKLMAKKEGIPFFEMDTVITAGYIAFISLIATLLILLRYRTFEKRVQDYYRIYFILFLFTLAVIFLIPGFRFSVVTFIPVSLAIPLSRYFISLRRRIFKEVIFDLFLISIIINSLDLSFLKF